MVFDYSGHIISLIKPQLYLVSFKKIIKVYAFNYNISFKKLQLTKENTYNTEYKLYQLFQTQNILVDIHGFYNPFKKPTTLYDGGFKKRL